MICVIDSQSATADDDEMAAITAFNDRLRADGHWVMAAGLQPPAVSQLIDGRSDSRSINAG
ncbi:MAG: hypothetical protein ACKOFP_00150 [Actinomycetota bacterium]